MTTLDRSISQQDVDIKADTSHREAVVQAIESANGDKGLWQLIRENPRVIAFAFLANCGSFLFGYDVLVQGAITALPMFSVYYGSIFHDAYILPALWQGLWQAFNAAGIMLGAATNGFMQDRFGRKPMFFVGGAISALGAAITYVSSELTSVDQRRGLLLVGKFIIGVSMGISMSTCQTYVSEIAPPRLRTILLGFYPFIITVGQMIAISVVFSRVSDMTPASFRVPFASQWAFSGYAMLVAFIVPESPVYLVTKDKISQAKKSLKLLGSSEEQILVIQSTIEQEMGADAEETSMRECFQGTDWRRTRIVCLLNSLQQFIGVSLVSNSTYFFIMAGMSPTMSLTLNQVGVGCSMACTLISWVVMSRIGRRLSILASFVMAGLIFLGMGIAGCWSQSRVALRFIGVALLLAACCSNLGVGTAYPIAAAEIPSMRLRAKSLGVGFVTNAFMTWAFSLCVPYMFNSDQGNLGGKIGFVFCGFCVVGFVLSWIEIPETKDISYARIDALFHARAPAQKFKAMSQDRLTVDYE